MTQFHTADINPKCCCFSPDGKLIAVAINHIAHVWDITGSDPQLIETFTGHRHGVASLTFSSSTSLISGSYDKSVKFWQIGSSKTSPVVTGLEFTPLTPAPIKSITLQAKDSITISSHSDGVVRIWDIVTGICKATFQTPSKDSNWVDTQLIDGKLISE